MKTDLLKNTIFLVCLCITCSFHPNRLSAQDSTSKEKFLKDSIEKEMDSVFNDASFLKEKSFWLANVNYLSNNVYFGRKDSVPSPYFTASLGYYHKSGLFVNASASYLTEPGQGRIDLATIDGGYSLITTKFEGLITVSKYIYSSESYNVRSKIEGSASILLAYDLGFVKPALEGVVNLGDNTDYGATFGLEHTFYAMDKRLSITPTANANASTQNYYNNYFKFRRYSLDRLRLLKRLLGEITISAYVENPGQFKILDYEFSIPINFTQKRFSFNVLPTFAIPVNPAVTDVTTSSSRLGTRTIVRGKEQLTASLFFTVGVSYSF